MKIYDLISHHLVSFLLDLADKEEFMYEVTFKKDKLVNTIRSPNLYYILKKIEKFNISRDAYISPFNSRYPEKSSDFLFGRKMISSNSVVIDIDSKEGIVDHKIILERLKENKISKPTYLISSGSGCHLWYILTSHVGRSKILDIHHKIKSSIMNIKWPKDWFVDDLSAKQQIRIPMTINHKCDKIAMIVNKGEKLKIGSYNFTKPESYTKKELKETRKSRKVNKPKTSPKKVIDKTKIIPKNRFFDGADNLEVILKEEINVCEEKLCKIISLLSYGKSYLSCRVAGESLGISYKAASKFLKKCVILGYLKQYTDKNSAYCYEVMIKHEIRIKNKKPVMSRCSISGPGESNRAICRLAYQTYINNLNPQESISNWLCDYYDRTSKEHDEEELINLFNKVYQKFFDNVYKPYKKHG